MPKIIHVFFVYYFSAPKGYLHSSFKHTFSALHCILEELTLVHKCLQTTVITSKIQNENEATWLYLKEHLQRLLTSARWKCYSWTPRFIPQTSHILALNGCAIIDQQKLSGKWTPIFQESSKLCQVSKLKSILTEVALLCQAFIGTVAVGACSVDNAWFIRYF